MTVVLRFGGDSQLMPSKTSTQYKFQLLILKIALLDFKKVGATLLNGNSLKEAIRKFSQH